jgi:hypothetical protein
LHKYNKNAHVKEEEMNRACRMLDGSPLRFLIRIIVLRTRHYYSEEENSG